MMIDSMSVEMVCPEAHPSPLLLTITTAISICLFSLVFFVKMSLLRESQAKPEVVETVIWSVVVTARQTAVPRNEAPATTTKYLASSTIVSYRISLRGT